jgi:hypothetical protein
LLHLLRQTLDQCLMLSLCALRICSISFVDGFGNAFGERAQAAGVAVLAFSITRVDLDALAHPIAPSRVHVG